VITPLCRKDTNYFAVGDSSESFSYLKDWVEKKVRRHMMRARKRQGFGWKRWSKRWIYNELGLFNNYRVRRYAPPPKALSA
jgi:RNA-directed DNA polymerase